MSRTSIHVNPELEGEVVGALEEAGFDIEVGNGGPMVDFVIDQKELDGITLSDEAPEGWKPLPADDEPEQSSEHEQTSEDEYKGGYTHEEDDADVRIFGTTSDGSGHRFAHETVLDDATEQQRYQVYRIYHPDRLIQSIHSGFEGDFEAAKEKACELALEYAAEEEAEA